MASRLSEPAVQKRMLNELADQADGVSAALGKAARRLSTETTARHTSADLSDAAEGMKRFANLLRAYVKDA